MKAKKIVGLMACAAACVSLSAFGNQTNGWFGVTVANTTVTTINVATNNVGEAQNSKLVLEDVDKSAPLTFTPSETAPTNRNDGVFVIQAEAELTPNSASDLDGAVTEGAKAGFAVGVNNDVTNFYGYANGAWTQLTGANVPTLGNNTNFKLVMNYRDNKIQFFVDDTILASNGTAVTEFVLASGTTAPIGIDAYGTGSISSITGAYEVAVAAYGDNKYGSVAEAVKAAKADSHLATDVQPVDANGVTQPSNTPAANGLNFVVCEALGLNTDDSHANIDVTPRAIDTAADAITLTVALPINAEPEMVKFGVTPAGGVTTYYENADNIQIPLEAGTYTITPTLR